MKADLKYVAKPAAKSTSKGSKKLRYEMESIKYKHILLKNKTIYFKIQIF